MIITPDYNTVTQAQAEKLVKSKTPVCTICGKHIYISDEIFYSKTRRKSEVFAHKGCMINPIKYN